MTNEACICIPELVLRPHTHIARILQKLVEFYKFNEKWIYMLFWSLCCRKIRRPTSPLPIFIQNISKNLRRWPVPSDFSFQRIQIENTNCIWGHQFIEAAALITTKMLRSIYCMRARAHAHVCLSFVRQSTQKMHGHRSQDYNNKIHHPIRFDPNRFAARTETSVWRVIINYTIDIIVDVRLRIKCEVMNKL